MYTKKVAKVMEIVVEQRLILTHAFNYRLVGYVLVFPLQLAYCICYYQPPSDYLNLLYVKCKYSKLIGQFLVT